MRILLSNDDGVHAPGIKSLYRALSPEYETFVIAPLEERSTTGHSISLDKPLRLEKIENNIYGCSGFPGDCVLVGLGHLLKERRPDLVISGINRGANLGQDLYYSGTIAAAREAAFHKTRSIAVSLVLSSVTEEYRFDVAATFVKWCLEVGLHELCAPLSLININVPNIPLEEIKGCRLTEIGFRHYSEEIHARVDTRGREYFWIAGVHEGDHPNPKADCMAVNEGYIAITIHPLVAHSEINTESYKKVIEALNEKFNS